MTWHSFDDLKRMIKDNRLEDIRVLAVDNLCIRSRITGQSLLHVAVYENRDTIVELLLNKNRDLLLTYDNNNATPLHYAALGHNTHILKKLLEVGKEKDECEEVVNAQDQDGFTALHIAAEEGDFRSVLTLIKYEADFKLVDNYNRTPIYFLQQNWNVKCDITNPTGKSSCAAINTLCHIMQVKINATKAASKNDEYSNALKLLEDVMLSQAKELNLDVSQLSTQLASAYKLLGSIGDINADSSVPATDVPA